MPHCPASSATPNNSRQSACRNLASSATDAFQLQQAGQFGRAGRNIVRGPNTRVFDFSLHRDFPVREHGALEFRWEVVNTANTTQFALPGRDWSSSAAGSITSLSGDPRVMQFALKLKVQASSTRRARACRTIAGTFKPPKQGELPIARSLSQLQLRRASLTIASRLRSTSSSVVTHEDTLIRIAVCPCHTVDPAQHVPSS